MSGFDIKLLRVWMMVFRTTYESLRLDVLTATGRDVWCVLVRVSV